MDTDRPFARGTAKPSLWRVTPFRLEDHFPPDDVRRAREYQRPLRRLRVVMAVLNLAALVAIIGFRFGPRVVDALGAGSWIVQVVAVVVAVSVVLLPLDVASSAFTELVHDKRWELSTQTVRGFIVDRAKDLVVMSLLMSVVLVPVYAVLRATELWWVWASAVFGGLLLVMAFVYPVVIMPVFNRFTPIDDEDLKARVDTIAARAGLSVQGSYTMDASRRTRRDNAFVSGYGRSKRVVIFDTMLEHPPHVVDQVVAHEIGHYRLHHILTKLPASALLMLGVFAGVHWVSSAGWVLDAAGVRSIAEPAAVPLFVLAMGVFFLPQQVITAVLSRMHEREADLEALELLGDPGAMVDVWRRMAPKNLVDLEPTLWKRITASHPHVAERMAFAQRWAELNGVPVREPGPLHD